MGVSLCGFLYIISTYNLINIMEPNTQPHVDASAQPVATPVAPMDELPKSKQIFSEAWALFKGRFWELQKLSWLPFVAMIAAALVIVILAGAFILSTGGFDNLERMLVAMANPLFALPAMIIGMALMLSLILFGAWCQIALMYTIGKGDMGIKRALAETRNLILSYYWVSILLGLIVLGGFILFIVPGVYLAIALSLTMFVLILEREKGLNAIIKSREYTRGNVWRITKYALYTLVYIVPAYLVLFLIQIVTKNTPVAFIYDIVSQVFSLVFAPLLIAYGYRVYEHIKLQKSSMVFAPTVNTRRKYMALGIFGALVIPIIMLIVLFAALNGVR